MMRKKNIEREGGYELIHSLTSDEKHQIDLYVDILTEANLRINLVSRRISRDDIFQLIGETVFLNRWLEGSRVVDVGSGNGLLGIPLAILNRERKFNLVESKQKKAGFLIKLVENLGLNNVEIMNMSIREYFDLKERNTDDTLVGRGFSNHIELLGYFEKGFIQEILLVTSMNKIKKIPKVVENSVQKIYNIPYRENLRVLKILKTENVSRET